MYVMIDCLRIYPILSVGVLIFLEFVYTSSPLPSSRFHCYVCPPFLRVDSELRFSSPVLFFCVIFIVLLKFSSVHLSSCTSSNIHGKIILYLLLYLSSTVRLIHGSLSTREFSPLWHQSSAIASISEHVILITFNPPGNITLNEESKFFIILFI